MSTTKKHAKSDAIIKKVLIALGVVLVGGGLLLSLITPSIQLHRMQRQMDELSEQMARVHFETDQLYMIQTKKRVTVTGWQGDYSFHVRNIGPKHYIDPKTPNASQYKIELSPGIGNGTYEELVR